MKRFQQTNIWMIAFGCLVILAFFYLSGMVSLTSIMSKSPEFVDVMSKMRTSSRDCFKLVDDWSKFNMSEEYFRQLPTFQRRLQEVKKGAAEAEGHSGQLPQMTRIMHLVASSGNVKTVCETGFNYGHSSFNWLTANKNVFVHSFDLGSHTYARKMAEVLKEMFRFRIEVHFGDSTKTVPEFKASGNLPRCDFILVDGGHVYPVARADLINFGIHASPDNIVMFDDYPTGWGAPFGKAWDELLVKGEDLKKIKDMNANVALNSPENLGIVELMRCTFGGAFGLERGFTLGKYVLKS